MKKMTKFKPEILKERIEKSGKSMETLSKEIGRSYGYIRACMKKGVMSEEAWNNLNALLDKKELSFSMTLGDAPKECCAETKVAELTKVLHEQEERIVLMNESMQRNEAVIENLCDRIDKLEDVIARVSLANVDILDRLEKVEKKKKRWWQK